jgi:3-phenylpropionate/cinnamic acid dioxygenase small subunit
MPEDARRGEAPSAVAAAWQPSPADVIDLVYREARLLDDKDYDAWLALFAKDGRYWLPMSRAQTDWVGVQSIAIEDMLMLRVRVERLKSPKVYAQQPPVLCQHVLQAPAIEEMDHAANRYRARAPFLYCEFRHDEQLVLAGVATFLLRAEGERLVIVEKRVDLLNAGAALPGIFLMP